jgi:hypothetical protein
MRREVNRSRLEVLNAAELKKAQKDLIIRRSWKSVLVARGDRQFASNRFTRSIWNSTS